MAFYVNKAQLAAHRGLKGQWDDIVSLRRAHNANEASMIERTGMVANDARIGEDAWRDFDRTVQREFLGDEGGSLLDDLMPLARSLRIGAIVAEYKKVVGGELEVRTSIDGQHAKPVNKGSDEYAGTLIPIHTTQVGRNWRELTGMREVGWDAMLEDQENAVRFIRRRTIDNFVNGSRDLKFKGAMSYGITNNPATLALNLGAAGVNVDLTDPAVSIADVRKAFIAALQTLQGEGNNARGNVTFYLSDAIWFNLMGVVNPQVSSVETMLDVVRRIPGVADIKKTDTVTGNAFFGIILSGEYIRPLVGMPITSTPIARVTPMDDFHVLVWGASGLQIKSDTNGRSGVLYASEA